jgi:hypothetical protein
MSIQLLDGGTTTTAGGAAQTFDRTNVQVNNGYEYADSDEADFFARQKVIAVARMPQEQSDGSWSKMKVSLRFIMPITLASGDIAFNVGRCEVEYHPEASSANIAEIREMIAQLAIGSGYDDIYVAGTLPA